MWNLILIILLLLFPVAIADIRLGSKISPNELCLSSSGNFSFGFFNISDQSDQLSAGIQFSGNIPDADREVVWVAGGGSVVGLNSYLEFTQEGGLVLFNGLTKAMVWRAVEGRLDATSAVLRDDGNLVILNDKNIILWQSFLFPSNTIVPGQNFFSSQTLIGSSVNSLYTFSMDHHLGQIELSWASIKFWDSGSPTPLNVSAAIFTSTGALQLLNENSEPIWSVFGEDHDDPSVHFRFLRLDVDGNLRMYSWKEESQSWKSVWQAVEDQCQVHATCGKRGICKFNPSGTGIHDCDCIFTSSSRPDPNSSECLLPDPQECKATSLVEYQHTSLYHLFSGNNSFFESSLEKCKLCCLHDPECRAVTFDNKEFPKCLMIKSRYASGYSHPSVGSITFLKKCPGPSTVLPAVDSYISKLKPSPSSYRLEVWIGVLSGISIFVLMNIASGYFVYLYRRNRSASKKAELALTVLNSDGLIRFSFTEIKELAREFVYQIGRRTFKGLQTDRQAVAIRELDSSIEERKFRGVSMTIGQIQHKNLVKLKGYCCELDHRFLVFEYVSNGSLDKYIEDPKLCMKLTWEKRVEICLSVAKAIHCLHTNSREFVNHGNLKCQNVVLDENLEAKVIDFGLGNFQDEASTYSLSPEKDVEDFGKMVLILVTGCQEVDQHACYDSWFYGQSKTETVDKRIVGEVNSAELERLLRIAFWCIQRDEQMRPPMVEVVEVLEGTWSVDPPPPPFHRRRRPLEDEEESSDS